MIEYIITGGTGWLGRNVVDTLLNGSSDFDNVGLLGEGNKIRVLCFPHEVQQVNGSFDDRVELCAGDLTDKASLNDLFRDVDGAVLIHLAGLIHPKLWVKDFEKVNFEGSRNLVELALNAGISKTVIMSSNSPIGCNPNNEHLFTEESPFNPYMGYGKSKHKLELYLQSVIAKNVDMPISIIRAPWFYGPYQPARQKLFFEMIRDGKGPIVGSGDNKRSMAYVGNLSQGILLAAQKAEANNEVFWIADEKPYTMHEIINTVESLLETEFGQNCKHKRLKLPDIASEVALMIDWTLQSVGIYHQKIHVLSEMNKNIACSVDKARQVLGYQPVVALEEGMRRSLKELF